MTNQHWDRPSMLSQMPCPRNRLATNPSPNLMPSGSCFSSLVFQASLYCSLIHTTITECRDNIYEQYTALSYVWGEAENVKPTFIHSRPSWITANLAAALDTWETSANLFGYGQMPYALTRITSGSATIGSSICGRYLLFLNKLPCILANEPI